MADEVIVDLRGAPPAQGGATSDYIPRACYPFRVSKAEVVQTKTGKTMVTVMIRVVTGDYVGRQIKDQFVFPKSPDESKFGVQRFHAFMLACGLPVKPETRFKLPLATLVNKGLYADVDDDEIPASDDGKYPAKKISKPTAYYSVAEIKAQANGAAAAPEAVTTPAPTPAPAPTPEPEPEPEEALADLEPVAAAAPAANGTATVEDDIDDLFK